MSLSFGNKLVSRILKSAVFVISSLFFAVPFMNGNLWFFGWIGLVVLFLDIFEEKKTLKRVFCSLFCFFFLFYVFAYSWFASLYPLDFAGLNEKESMVVILLGTVLVPIIHGLMMSLCCFVGFCSSKFTHNSVLKVMCIAAGYTLGEFVQSVGTFAFPWARLFVGQTDMPVLLQSASLFGSYFVTFLVVAVNGLIALSIINRKSKNKRRLFALAAIGVFIVNLVFGAVRIAVMTEENDEKMTAVVLQGNIPSGEKWRASTYETLEIYDNLADKAVEELNRDGKTADAAVIPETAFVSVFEGQTNVNDDSFGYLEKGIFGMSQKLNCPVFAGAFNGDDKGTYNSVFPFSPDGSIGKPYNKQNLVPFGEFLPYRSFLMKVVPFIAELNMLSSDLTAGTDYEPLNTQSGKAACLVCFDSIFPENARKQVKNGADFIVVSTNDSWYKTSDALEQHANHSVMRAIENARPVLRSANTGISTVVSPVGIEVGRIDAQKRDCLVVQVDKCNTTTLYTLIGDVLVPVCLLYLLTIPFIYGINKRRTLKKKSAL